MKVRELLGMAESQVSEAKFKPRKFTPKGPRYKTYMTTGSVMGGSGRTHQYDAHAAQKEKHDKQEAQRLWDHQQKQVMAQAKKDFTKFKREGATYLSHVLGGKVVASYDSWDPEVSASIQFDVKTGEHRHMDSIMVDIDIDQMWDTRKPRYVWFGIKAQVDPGPSPSTGMRKSGPTEYDIEAVDDLGAALQPKKVFRGWFQ